MSAEETVLNLFDTNWFEQRVFTSKPSLSTPFLQGGDEEEDEEIAADDNTMNLMATLMRKSYSDQFLNSLESGSPSPKSVLGPHLQTILSGKEVQSFDDSLPEEEEEKQIQIHETKPDRATQTVRDRRRRRRRKSGSRSLSELEFEELKGFMDLGFVFSDEDRDSRLVSIIPGLQRLGKNVEDTTSVSRPYLSEAWDCVGEGDKRVKNPLIDWRIPSFGNEMELKDHLKFWAHTVASTVR